MLKLPLVVPLVAIAGACTAAEPRTVHVRGAVPAALYLFVDDGWSEFREGDPLPDRGTVLASCGGTPSATVGAQFTAGPDDVELVCPRPTAPLQVVAPSPGTLIVGVDVLPCAPSTSGCGASFDVEQGSIPEVAITRGDLVRRTRPQRADLTTLTIGEPDAPLATTEIGIVGEATDAFAQWGVANQRNEDVLLSAPEPLSRAHALPRALLRDGELAVWRLCRPRQASHPQTAIGCTRFLLDDALPPGTTVTITSAPVPTLTVARSATGLTLAGLAEGRVTVGTTDGTPVVLALASAGEPVVEVPLRDGVLPPGAHVAVTITRPIASPFGVDRAFEVLTIQADVTAAPSPSSPRLAPGGPERLDADLPR